MTRHLSLSFFLLTVLPSILSAQALFLALVLSGERFLIPVTGAPIRGALVQFSAGSPNATLTDSEGSFHFDNLPLGAIS